MTMSETRITCIVADDEPHIRTRIAELAAQAGLQVLGKAANGTEALALIRHLEPAIAFLDIRMPGLDGLELAERLSELRQPPVVVFVTAYGEHALAAFELSAIDYVVKPVETQRFTRAVDRAKAIAQASTAADALVRLKGALGSERPQRITLRSGAEFISVPPTDIIRFQALDDYVEAHLSTSSHLLSVTMTALETVLSPPFIRIHRSHIVNIDYIRACSATGGRTILEMSDGQPVPVSRSRKTAVLHVLDGQ